MGSRRATSLDLCRYGVMSLLLPDIVAIQSNKGQTRPVFAVCKNSYPRCSSSTAQHTHLITLRPANTVSWLAPCSIQSKNDRASELDKVRVDHDGGQGCLSRGMGCGKRIGRASVGVSVMWASSLYGLVGQTSEVEEMVLLLRSNLAVSERLHF